MSGKYRKVSHSKNKKKLGKQKTHLVNHAVSRLGEAHVFAKWQCKWYKTCLFEDQYVFFTCRTKGNPVKWEIKIRFAPNFLKKNIRNWIKTLEKHTQGIYKAGKPKSRDILKKNIRTYLRNHTIPTFHYYLPYWNLSKKIVIFLDFYSNFKMLLHFFAWAHIFDQGVKMKGMI